MYLMKFEQSQEYIVEALVSWGMSRNAAIAMTHLQIVDSSTVIDLTKNTGLRQPEISKAIKELMKRGWVGEREIKKSGRGRPLKIYSNTIVFSEMLDQLEKEQQERRVAKVQLMLRSLRKLKY